MVWSSGESSPLGDHGLALPSSGSLLPETAARDLEGQVHIPPARCAYGALEARYYMEATSQRSYVEAASTVPLLAASAS